MPVRQIRIAQASGGTWQAIEDPTGPVRQYFDLLSRVEWVYRYCIGAAATGSVCCGVVIDRGEKETVLDEDRKIVMDPRGMPTFRWLGRKVVAQAYHEDWQPAHFASILRKMSLYWDSACLCIVANQVGSAVTGEAVRLPTRESLRLYLRQGKVTDFAMSFREQYGYTLTTETREPFWAALSEWIEADPPLKAPPSVMDSALRVVRSESGALPADVTPDTVRACALAAAIHGSRQAQEADRAPHVPPHTGADYSGVKRDTRLRGDGAWWGYAVGARGGNR